MEWDIGMEKIFDDLMEVISPVLDKEFHESILDGRFWIISMRYHLYQKCTLYPGDNMQSVSPWQSTLPQ